MLYLTCIDEAHMRMTDSDDAVYLQLFSSDAPAMLSYREPSSVTMVRLMVPSPTTLADIPREDVLVVVKMTLKRKEELATSVQHIRS